MGGMASRIIRNITNTVQAVDVPEGAIQARIAYSDSGTAGPLRICFEAASLIDATHRLATTGYYLSIASGQIVPAMSFSGGPVIYIRTDSAIGGGTNTLSITFGVE